MEDHEIFDDLGRLVEYMKDMDEDDLGKAFIKDESGKKWSDVKQLSYVYDKDIWTPYVIWSNCLSNKR